MDGNAARSNSAGTERPAVTAAAAHLARALLRSRLLLAYCAFGALSGLATGVSGLASALVNYLVLLPLYTLVIYLWTYGRPTLLDDVAGEAAGDSTWRRDLALVVVVFGLNVANSAWFWSGGPPSTVQRPVFTALQRAGWDRELAGTVANGVGNTLFALLPALVATLVIYRLRPRQLALIPRDLGLAGALIGLGVVLAGIVHFGTGKSTVLFRGLELMPLALAIAAAQLFVNGLPEEFIYRGAIMGRLLHWLRRPHLALILSSILFVSSHIPSYIARGVPPIWLLALVSPGPQPTGLIWGYLCYRTRSIWPGVLWHATGWILGVTFL